MRTHPFIEVSVGGAPVASAFYSRLVSATIHDAPGQEADTIELKLDDGGNELVLPAVGAIVDVRFGYRGFGSQRMGRFVIEEPQIEGGAGGEFLCLSGRSADMRSDLKEPLSEHFDETTVGGLVQELAGRHGMSAKVDPDLASIQLPYLARVEQSSVDLLTRLADRLGGFFSVKGGMFVLSRFGGLAALAVDRSECESWRFSLKPRPSYGRAEAAWFDRERGEVRFEEHRLADGPARRLRHALPSQAEARTAAKAESERLGRGSGSGSITLAGRPDILADAPLRTTGFRPEANGVWRCCGVDHTFSGTYMTTLELEAPEEGKR